VCAIRLLKGLEISRTGKPGVVQREVWRFTLPLTLDDELHVPSLIVSSWALRWVAGNLTARGLLRMSRATCLQGSYLIPFPTSFVLCRALCVNGVESGNQPLISFLKRVAASAALPCPRATTTLGGVVPNCVAEMAVYSLTGNASSPFQAEPEVLSTNLLLLRLSQRCGSFSREYQSLFV
jgi:hypothetical protein